MKGRRFLILYSPEESVADPWSWTVRRFSGVPESPGESVAGVLVASCPSEDAARAAYRLFDGQADPRRRMN